MHPYINRSGKSNVASYEYGEDFIHIMFHDENRVYVYDYTKPGKFYVDRMKQLADAGRGLNSFIGRRVKKNYARIESLT